MGNRAAQTGAQPCPLWGGLAAILPPGLPLLFLIPPFREQINHPNKSSLEPGHPKAKLKPFLSRGGETPFPRPCWTVSSGVIYQYFLAFMREESYLCCIKMTLKFAQYCNVANVVLISIWAADNLFRQEHLIGMQGGQSCGLGLPPFYFQCKYRSASGRGSYSLQEDKVRTLKQMEDLLNSLLGVWMRFILISLLDRNVFFTSDKEPGKQWPGCVSSGRPGPGWLSTPGLFSQINQEASQCQGGWGF